MPASLATLSTNHVDTYLEAFGDMLWMPDHVHVENARFMDSFNDMLWGYTDSGDKQLGSTFNYYVDKFIKFAFGVIVAAGERIRLTPRPKNLIMNLGFQIPTLFSLHCLQPVESEDPRQMALSCHLKSP